MSEKFESGYLPVLPLREAVVFPSCIASLPISRKASISALETALENDKTLFVACQFDPRIEEPSSEDLYAVGTVIEVLQVLRVHDGSIKAVVKGKYMARSLELGEEGDYLRALVVKGQVRRGDKAELIAHKRSLRTLFDRYMSLTDHLGDDALEAVTATNDPLAFLYGVAHYCSIKVEDKQQVLELDSAEEKFLALSQALEAENHILELENKIAGEVQTQLGKSQREIYLSEQLKVIEKELGLGTNEDPEVADLLSAVDGSDMPELARSRAEKELARLSRMPQMSPEAAVTRTYIEWLLEVPWTRESDDPIDLTKAAEILDSDHYGLKTIKERIVEYLAVLKLSQSHSGPILCFVGPPGVGKTSLAKSIAHCMGREFMRISLGGVRDEAEIRGHRRTYVGAMPGKIIQSMKRASTVNPIFLLDEIDKMSSDFRGDPASALLEVLDPEQNKSFVDHYLEVDYDLSNVTFISTANTMNGIPHPLLDRMETIRLAGYTEEEKFEIASRHLIPRQRKNHGLKASEVKLSKSIMKSIISDYTREAGVRELDRTIAKVCRKVAVEVVNAPNEKRQPVRKEHLKELLGPAPYRNSDLSRTAEIGSTLGLAWTEVGGAILPVETTLMTGKGSLQLTGKLGEVMQESAKAALSYVRAHAVELGIDPEFYQETDIHIHVPEGAIPKDGPSAGITMATSLVSALAHVPCRQDVAMTGEITLRGRVLKIGGLKEKALAAHRRRISTIIIPSENIDDIEEIADEIRSKLTFVPVSQLSEVLDHALLWEKGFNLSRKRGSGGSRRSSSAGRVQPRS